MAVAMVTSEQTTAELPPSVVDSVVLAPITVTETSDHVFKAEYCNIQQHFI
jgi:hypothetical protein